LSIFANRAFQKDFGKQKKNIFSDYKR